MAVFLFALLVRLIYLGLVGDQLFQVGYMGEYPHLAQNIIHGKGFVIDDKSGYAAAMVDIGHPIDPVDYQEPEGHVPKLYNVSHISPGYPYFIAGVFKVFGERLLWLNLVQILLDSCCIFLLWAIVIPVFGERAALWSTLIYALRLPVARFSLTILKGSILPFFLLLTTFFFLKIFKSREPKHKIFWSLCCAISITACSYIRFEFILLTLAFPLFIWLSTRNLKDAAQLLAVLASCLIILSSPWVIRNKNVFGKAFGMQYTHWVTLWHGFGQIPNDFGAAYDEASTWDMALKEGFPADKGKYHDLTYNDFLKPKVIRVLTHEPLFIARLWITRAWWVLRQRNYWGFPQIEDQKYSYLGKGISPIRYAIKYPKIFFLKTIGIIENFVFILLALLGVYVALRNKLSLIGGFGAMLILAIPAYNIAMRIVTVMDSRYVLPGNVLLCPFVAVALIYIFDKKLYDPSNISGLFRKPVKT
ncbi:glycosyltransferase family 39 protein [Elusimicrobiota bacterium]